mgnify:CR=1 FL=1
MGLYSNVYVILMNNLNMYKGESMRASKHLWLELTCGNTSCPSYWITRPVYNFFSFFSVWLLSVLRGHSFFHPRHNGQLPSTSKDFYPRFYPLHFFPILILQNEPAFPFLMLSAKQGNYWYHFITSLVWRGPWLGIGPGTSRTRNYTTIPLGYRGGGKQ